MNVTRYGDSFEKRIDPWGREYYWLIGGPAADTAGHETDLSALAKGKVTITPLDYNLTRQAALAEMERWPFRLSATTAECPCGSPTERPLPTVRTQPRKLQKGVGNAH